jgi:hypothetical protein
VHLELALLALGGEATNPINYATEHQPLRILPA